MEEDHLPETGLDLIMMIEEMMREEGMVVLNAGEGVIKGVRKIDDIMIDVMNIIMSSKWMKWPCSGENWTMWSVQCLVEEPHSVLRNLLMSGIFVTTSLMLVGLSSNFHITMVRLIPTSMSLILKGR